jgi:hypothetical protein
MTKPDLSNATCYYRTRESRWLLIIVIFLGFAFSIYETISGINQGLQWDQLMYFQGRYGQTATPLFVWPLLVFFFVILLLLNAPAFFYSGPTLGISKEGIYFEFLGGNLILIGWDDINRFYGKDVTSQWRRTTTIHNIYIELKDSRQTLEHIKERLGKVPFVFGLQFAFRDPTKSLRILADNIEDATRDQILDQLGTQLSEYRQRNIEGALK